ncbi:MAG: response regulator [Phycisphaerae bacterium]|jgi:signal transduction histidine kinase
MKKTGNTDLLHILLVEDSASDAVLLQESILSSGVKDLSVSVVGSLRESTDHIKNNHIDATLLDLSLPDSSGLETIRRVRSACPDMPIVVLTGVDDEKTGIEAVRMGAQDYLVKGQADGRLIARAVRYAIERKRAEQEIQKAKEELEVRVRQRTAELRRSQEKLRSLTAELELTEERERRRIASDLHDSIGQILSFASRELKTMQKSSPAQLSESLLQVSSQLDKAVEQARTLSFDLSPSILYDLGFEVAIEDLVDKFSKEKKIRCSFNTCSTPKPLADDVKILLYRAVRELLINAAKHSRAGTAKVSLLRSGDDICVTVEDDGRGFDASVLKGGMEKVKGFGIFNIRERLNHIGGQFKIESWVDKGTKVTLIAPLNLEEDKRSKK